MTVRPEGSKLETRNFYKTAALPSGRREKAGCGDEPLDESMPLLFARPALEALYARYNRRELIHPDPLEFLYRYDDPLDREVVGFVASSLAYGRVRQILASVGKVLDRMGPSPRRFLADRRPAGLRHDYRDFKHRFTAGDQLAALLAGMRSVLRRDGSLEACFLAGSKRTRGGDGVVLSGLTHLVERITSEGGLQGGSMLLPSPVRGSACKRLNLFLRWMVRQDDVDPGGWKALPPAALIVPLDTHMHRISLQMGITKRKQADLRTALEVTARFRSLAPDDPVRYDFALTRLGILPGGRLGGFSKEGGSDEQL